MFKNGSLYSFKKLGQTFRYNIITEVSNPRNGYDVMDKTLRPMAKCDGLLVF